MAEGAPSREAELLRAFVNTRDVEAGTDALADPAALVDWLADHGLLSNPTSQSSTAARADEHALALALRETLRVALRRQHGNHGQLGDRSTRDVSQALPLVLDVTAKPPVLRPARGGVRGALAALLAPIPGLVADGSWARLKICPADDCGWAFYDGSRNRSRNWCAMSACGNRTKTRAYRARRKASS